MPRFVSERDFRLFQHFNTEIVEDIVDVQVVLYKIISDFANINIYGEATPTSIKERYRGISLSALVLYSRKVPEGQEGFGFDISQTVQFRFVRKLLRDVDVYPEVGDIVGFDGNFYEINNITETQLIAGRPEFSHSILCETHLTRVSALNIVETHI
jgi:hypothetical protein